MKTIHGLRELQGVFDTKNRLRMLKQASPRDLLQKREQALALQTLCERRTTIRGLVHVLL